MTGRKVMILIVAALFVLTTFSIAIAADPPAKSGATQPAPKSTRQAPPVKRADVEFKGGIITGTIYLSDQADWGKVDCKKCDCIQVGVDTQTGTTTGQLAIPTYTDVVPPVKATGGAAIGPNAKCTYKIVIPAGKNLKNLRVGAKYTGKIVPSPGSVAITSEPKNLDNPFSIVPGGSVTSDMNLKIQYIK